MPTDVATFDMLHLNILESMSVQDLMNELNRIDKMKMVVSNYEYNVRSVLNEKVNAETKPGS